MKRINKENINNENYWNEHIAEPEFGLRQEKYLELAGKGHKIAEIGCGVSPFLNKALDNFQYADGLDYSKETYLKAEKKFPKVQYFWNDFLQGVPWKGKTVDVSVAGEVIEHLENPDKLLEIMARVTKRRIIISTAKMEYNDPEHLWEFTVEDLKNMGEKHGKTEVEEIKSDWFPGRSYLFLTIDL